MVDGSTIPAAPGRTAPWGGRAVRGGAGQCGAVPGARDGHAARVRDGARTGDAVPVGSADESVELRIGPVAAGGGCVARAPDGRVVFVRHCLPGELVRARVTERTTRFWRADAVEVIEPSADRVEPPCRYAVPGGCGGCDWQHATLPAQRRLKAELVAGQLRRVAGIDHPVVVEEVPGAPDGLGWRTRVGFGVDRQGRIGLRRHRSHRLQPVDRCLIASAGVEAAGVERVRWPGADRVEVSASVDGSQRVVAVGTGRDRPGRRGSGRPFPAVDAGMVVDGRPRREPHRVEHRVRGRTFRVGAGVFWQVHVGAAAALAEAVLEGLAPRAGERVLDLYAGAGLFAALIGDAVGADGAVLAVEADRRAARDAARNTADQAQVDVVRGLVGPGAVSAAGRRDLVVLDPPRSGAGRDVTGTVLTTGARAVAYVACDPASFARDLRTALDAGWTLASLRAFDLFPMTEHVELVGVLRPPDG